MADEYGLAWLAPLLRTEFFGHCRNHNSTGKHERNHFCLDCHAASGALCPEGLGKNHKNHLSLQIRKASHRDAVRVLDIQKLLDVSSIQAYTINSSKILFLHSRPQKQSFKGGLRFNCETCHRSIADQVSFCSINCKCLAVGDANLATQDQAPSLNLAACSSSYNFYSPFHFSPIQAGSFSSTHQLAPNLLMSFGDGALQDYKLTHHTSNKNSKQQKHQLSNTTPSLWQLPNSSSNSSPVGSVKDEMQNSTTTTLLQLEIPDSPVRVESKRKRKLSHSEGSCFLLSPMSVLAVPTRSSNETSRTDLSPTSFSGPSTPPSIEEASTQTHSRKQCHPHRAPLF